MDYEQRAEELFREGYNCAQAVFLAFACEKMDRDEAARLASAFGGGLAGTRNTCGAVSGLAMAYGLLATPGSQGADIVCGEGQSFGLSQAFGGPYLGLMATRKAFVRNLPGRGRDVNYVPPSDRSTEYYKKRPCPKLCACAAGILAQYLETHP